jgi:preprotein translocase subunit YajC
MENGMDWLFWAVLIIGALAFLYVPQFLARRRQKKREEELAVGDDVMTIGGLMGRLTYLDFDDNVARIELADGVEVRIVPGAISGKREEQIEGTSQTESGAGDNVDEVGSTDETSTT